MSEIEKYKKYLRFKANAKYLTRDFIVPKYTGTEPDIYEDKKPNMNDPGMVVNPSKILPKNFTDDMPFVIDKNNTEQLELADGGRVSFNEGSKLTGTDKTLEENVREDHKAYNDYRKSIGLPTVPLDNEYIRMWIRTRLNKGGRVERQGYSFAGLVKETKNKLINESNSQKKFELKKRLNFLENLQKKSKNIQGAKSIENLILKKDKLGRPFFSDYLEKINVLEDLQNNKYLNPKTNKPFTPKEWLDASPSYRSKFRDPETFLEKKKEYQKEYMRQRKESDSEYKQEFLKKKKEEYYSKERENINAKKEIEPGKGVLREQRNKLLSYMSEAAKDNPNYQDIIKNGRFVGVADKENGINYYEAGYKGKLGKNSKLITAHPDYNDINDLAKLADRFKRELPNKAIASYFSAYERVPTMSEMYNFLQADPRFIEKMSSKFFQTNALHLHHQISLTESPSQKIQLLLQDRNDQAGKKLIEFQKGNITKEKLNKDLKKLNTRYYVDGIPLGAIETSPETQLKTAKSQTTKLFNKRLKENPELIEQMTKRLDINKTQMIANIGCPTLTSKSIGGRVNFSNGSNCYAKGLEKIQSGELNQAERRIASQFLKEAGAGDELVKGMLTGSKNILKGFKELALRTGVTFDDLIAFGRTPTGRFLGYGLGVGLPTYFAGEELLKGNIKQAGREIGYIPTLGFGLPESLVGSVKTDLISHAKEKGFNAESVEKILNKNEISKKINDVNDLLDIGSKNEKFIKNLQEKKESLYNEYNAIKLNPLDQENFNKILESFYTQNRERVPELVQAKNKISENVQKDIDLFKRSELDPAFAREEKIHIPLEPTKEPVEIEELPSEYKVSAAEGGRVGFSSGGPPAIKFAMIITDLLKSLKKDLSFSSHLEKLYGIEFAKKHTIDSYQNMPNRSRQSDILMRIDKIKKNLPQEYSGLTNVLDDIEKNVSNYDYIGASKKGESLLDKLPESFNFEKLPQDLFPMEDPLNNAFIIFDPKRERMAGRYTFKYSVDAETGKGFVEKYDMYDPVSKKMLEEKDWKLVGVSAREESGAITKEGLN
jgi:hypothetical protein